MIATGVSSRRSLFTFHDFVERALFDPRWGYYASGNVRFGDGGHFDTYPLALSPYFGEMIARRAFALWRSRERPRQFDICEIGAGNGQLCLDVLTTTAALARRNRDWDRFSHALSYRIIEKSSALRRRQAALLGPFARAVEWSSLDLSRSSRTRMRPRSGLVVANEVLDCLAHHKVVLDRRGEYHAVYVGARRTKGNRSTALLSRAEIVAALARTEKIHFQEYLLPASSVRGLTAFLQRHYPAGKVARRRRSLPWTYFACPAIEVFVANVASLYRQSEILLIDYGGEEDYHLQTPGARRIAAGRPEEKTATPYRAPGRDDITFLVDFSVAIRAAIGVGLQVAYMGPQGHLASLSGVKLDETAAEKIAAHRALGWLLAVSGVGPEQRQRAGSLSWRRPPGRRRAKTVARESREAIDEFLGRRRSTFQLLVLRKPVIRS